MNTPYSCYRVPVSRWSFIALFTICFVLASTSVSEAQPSEIPQGPDAQFAPQEGMFNEASSQQWGQGQRRGEGGKSMFRQRRQGQQGRNVQGRRGRERGGINKIKRFLEFVEDFHNSIKEPHKALMMASIAIKEHYKKAGNPSGAIEELEQWLAKATDIQTRTILLFQIRQTYEELGNNNKMLETTRRIMEENIKVVNTLKSSGSL